jgi:hypothetical protein
LNKPQPNRELVIEQSEQCDRCLMLYAVSAPARSFLKTECILFGNLKPISLDENDAPQLMRIIIGQPVMPSAPAQEPVVFTLHVWPNYDLQQVRTWLEMWPHVGEPFEQAINEIKERNGHH